MRKFEPKKIVVPTIVDEQPRRVPKQLKLETLPDAIQDGVPKFKVGDELVLRRDHLNDKKLYICVVLSVSDDGDVSLRNLTLQQGFVFNVKNPPTLKLYTVN